MKMVRAEERLCLRGKQLECRDEHILPLIAEACTAKGERNSNTGGVEAGIEAGRMVKNLQRHRSKCGESVTRLLSGICRYRLSCGDHRRFRPPRKRWQQDADLYTLIDVVALPQAPSHARSQRMRAVSWFFALIAFFLFSLISEAASPLPPFTPSNVNADGFLLTSIWIEGCKAEGKTDCSFHLTLLSKDLAGLSTRMHQISLDNQGHWLTENDLETYVRPADETTKTITDFLHSQGVPDSAIIPSKFGDRLNVTLPVEQVKKLFTADFWKTSVDQKQFNIVKQYLDQPAAAAIAASSPLQDLFVSAQGLRHHADARILLARDGPPDPLSCSAEAVTPQCLKDTYGFASHNPVVKAASERADVTTVTDTPHSVSLSDLALYVERFAPAAKDYKLTIETTQGGYNDEKTETLEGNYVVQSLVGLLAPLKVNLLIIARKQWEDFHEQVINIFIDNYTDLTRPKIVSIPWSGYEDFFTEAQAKTMCNAAQKLTALGTTVITTTGMLGVSDNAKKCPSFRPAYPGGCPYIISVGITRGFSQEIMLEATFPYDLGAGASDFFPLPQFQADLVHKYQTSIGPLKGMYNSNGRMYPDMAAHGSNHTYISGGKEAVITGEGSALQTATAILALVNSKRETAGRGTLGWIHPALYAAGILHDITTGGSFGCKQDKPDRGFPAGAGYDAPSGLGSPHFDLISKALGV